MIDLQPFYELDPEYQYSSAQHFFRSHVEQIDDLTAAIMSARKLNPRIKLPQLAYRLMRRMEIGLDVWEPPPEQIRRPN